MATNKQSIARSVINTENGSERIVQDGTLADRAYERILTMILDGSIPVGEKMPSENDLCKTLDVSRPVLRQALKQLRSDDVIVSRQGSGSYVIRKPEKAALDFAPVGSIADIQRTFEFRAAIEGEAAYLAALRRTDADLSRLKSILQELDRCIQQGELGVVADEEFHMAICETSTNPYFTAARASMETNILTGMNLTRNLSLTKPRERLELVQAEHYAIFKAISDKDAAASRAAMRAHVENARKRVFEGDTPAD
jgi:DNA-binding FadR family transcriptional regulator